MIIYLRCVLVPWLTGWPREACSYVFTAVDSTEAIFTTLFSLDVLRALDGGRIVEYISRGRVKN